MTIKRALKKTLEKLRVLASAKNIRKVLNELNLALGKDEMDYLEKETNALKEMIEKELSRSKIDADVFVGGSFAKGTLIKGDYLDIDIFVRFDPSYKNISEMLEKIVKKTAKKGLKIEKLRGSRDYFRVWKGRTMFEIIPVTKVKRPNEARNVTDLSYFHVNYVKKKLKNEKLRNEVIYAKQFCKASRTYGAESFVRGFSGYALECLIIYYGSFEKMLKELVKVKGRTIIDPEKLYKKKEDVLFAMNESKLNSPVIIVDPTWKERNVLAALSNETFEKFKKRASEFLKKPSKEFFVIKEINEKALRDEAKKKKAEFSKIELKTDKQAGDIAGTKMKKFADYLEREVEKYFIILNKKFDYNGMQKAKLYLIVKPKKEVIKIGPPVKMKKNAAAFRKANKNVFVKNGVLHSKIKIDFSAKKFVRDFAKKYADKIKAMNVTELRVY
ncbi:MAG: nucleotidyltransferase domain-containing protein [Candidatus Pacearchaeota archaeon]